MHDQNERRKVAEESCAKESSRLEKMRKTTVEMGGLPVGPVIFRFKKSNFPFQKKGNSVSIPFHYWQR